MKLENYTDAFLPNEISATFNTLNGSCVAKWLESRGYEVKSYTDTGNNGLAITTNGFAVSTNGFVYRVAT